MGRLILIGLVLLMKCFQANVSAATCTPDACVNNYVRGKLYEFQRWVIDEEDDEPLGFPAEYSRKLTTMFSETNLTFSAAVLTGLYPLLPVSSGQVVSSVLSGYQYVYLYSRQVLLSGSYSVSGTVLGNPIDSSGRYEIYCQISNGGYLYYTVNSAGNINVTSNSIDSYWYVEPDSIPSFENFMQPGDPIRPVLTTFFAENILNSLLTPLRAYTVKLKNHMATIFQGKSLVTLTTWEDVPIPATIPPPVPSTTERPLFQCLPNACMDTYYVNELKGLPGYATRNGLQRIPLNRSFSNRTLTTVFDLDLTYTDVVVDNFLDGSSGSPSFTNNLAAGSITVYWYNEVTISGSFTGNGTILGVPTTHAGRWTGRFRHRLYNNFRYSLSGNFEGLSVGVPSYSTLSLTMYGFSTDLFPTLHPLKQPFDALVQTQLTAVYTSTWVLDLLPYNKDFYNEVLSAGTFEQLITSQLPPTSPPVPTTTTQRPTTPSTPPPPFECEPDGCLVDYVKLKFSRFADWVDSADRDPLVLPGVHRVQFAIWDIDLYLENITVHGYLPTFLNAQTSLTSNCLSGTITMSTRSPSLQIYGNYNSSGTLEDYSLTGSGNWGMNISISSTLTLTYRLDTDGFIAELRDTFATSLSSRSGVLFENFIDPSAPLAKLLLDDIAVRASTLVAQQVRSFTSLITDFMNILLTENKFYDIITWHRYGNETTEPPVICAKNSRSSVSLNNWYVPIFGHVPLTIRGSRLDILQSLECWFEDGLTTIVPATIVDLNTATCSIPYLYQTGRIPVQVILTYPNGCQQTYEEVIFSAKPEDYRDTLTVSVGNDGKLDLDWDAAYFASSYLQLHVAELDHDTGAWVEKGILVPVLENTGSYSQIPDDLSLLPSLSNGFVLFLSPTEGAEMRLYSNVLYTSYGKSPEHFISACTSWYESDNGAPPSLEPCPPLLTQAWVDSRFEYEWDLQDYETLQFYHPGSQATFRQLIPNGNGSGSQCAYKNGELLIGPTGGGSADYASPNNRTGFIQHHIRDVHPWYICCGYSGDDASCRKYYEKRPSDDGTTYVPPPRPGNGEGDPHMTTFDGVSYTFNGVGEFYMIKGSNFEMQARMEQFIEAGNGLQRDGSTFTSFAFKEFSQERNETLVHIQLTAGENGLIVSVNQTLLQIPVGFSSKNGKPFVSQIQEGGSLAVFLGDDGAIIQSAFISFSTGFSFNASAIMGQGALNIISFAPTNLKGEGYSGLLGSYDGIPDNDLTYPGGVPLLLNSTIRDIHYDFGINWRTTEVESIFSYDFGKTHASYQNPNFEPNFDEPNFEDYPEIGEICGQSVECLYDYVSTGSADFAKETKQFQEKFEEVAEIIEEVVTMCTRLQNLEDGWFSLDNYMAGAVTNFYCNPGFVVTGSGSLTCGQDGNWNGQEPTCLSAADFDCTEKPDGYYADANDCSKYFGCLNGVMREHMCPYPMLFHSIRLTCVPAGSAVCAEII